MPSSPSSENSSMSSGYRLLSNSSKRRHNDATMPCQIENSTTGSIAIEECDPYGKFIKIKNNSSNVSTSFKSNPCKGSLCGSLLLISPE